MFGLFKRSKLLKWELPLLVKVLGPLPDCYSPLIKQIEDGLVKGVITEVGDIPGFVAFRFNYEIFNKYEMNSESYYKISNIEITDGGFKFAF